MFGSLNFQPLVHPSLRHLLPTFLPSFIPLELPPPFPPFFFPSPPPPPFFFSVPRTRILNLIGELMQRYRGQLEGLELDFQRGLDYFPGSTPQATRTAVMAEFLRDIRAMLGPDAVLGLRLSPNAEVLQRQGLGNLTQLVAAPAAGGLGVDYLNWAVYFWSFQPFDSQVRALAAQVPAEIPQFYEVTRCLFTKEQRRRRERDKEGLLSLTICVQLYVLGA